MDTDDGAALTTIKNLYQVVQECGWLHTNATGALVERVPALVAEVERLQAALRPFVTAWERETATCWGGGPCKCQRAAVVLDRDWIAAAQAAMRACNETSPPKN